MGYYHVTRSRRPIPLYIFAFYKSHFESGNATQHYQCWTCNVDVDPRNRIGLLYMVFLHSASPGHWNLPIVSGTSVFLSSLLTRIQVPILLVETQTCRLSYLTHRSNTSHYDSPTRQRPRAPIVRMSSLDVQTRVPASEINNLLLRGICE